VLTATDLSHAYGDTITLREVSLRVPDGEVVAIVGESGSGKTTLLRCFNRLVTPQRGLVTIDGVDVRSIPIEQLRRRIGFVPQSGGLLPHWRILRNVALVPTLIGMPEPERAASEALERVGLPSATFGARFPHELSGGQRQRAALARALAAQQSVVLLDEPFGALDAISRAAVHEAFEQLRRELGFTAVLVTHDLGEAARLADTVAVMRGGVLEQVGDITTLRRTPATAYVAELFRRADASADALGRLA
jgi:osmoprotectant transport system ATP-binding protein